MKKIYGFRLIDSDRYFIVYSSVFYEWRGNTYLDESILGLQ